MESDRLRNGPFTSDFRSVVIETVVLEVLVIARVASAMDVPDIDSELVRNLQFPAVPPDRLVINTSKFTYQSVEGRHTFRKTSLQGGSTLLRCFAFQLSLLALFITMISSAAVFGESTAGGHRSMRSASRSPRLPMRRLAPAVVHRPVADEVELANEEPEVAEELLPEGLPEVGNKETAEDVAPAVNDPVEAADSNGVSPGESEAASDESAHCGIDLHG